MSINKLRDNKIEQLRFLARTEKEKNIVIKAAKEICDAENDEQACKIAQNYREQLCQFLGADIVDIISILLKGGHIMRHSASPKDAQYLVFIPVPDFPKQKTLVANIPKKPFEILLRKGIISHQPQLENTDERGHIYSHYHLSEEIILRFKEA